MIAIDSVTAATEDVDTPPPLFSPLSSSSPLGGAPAAAAAAALEEVAEDPLNLLIPRMPPKSWPVADNIAIAFFAGIVPRLDRGDFGGIFALPADAPAVADDVPPSAVVAAGAFNERLGLKHR